MVNHTLDSIVRETMIDMGETNENRYAKMYNYAVGGLRELRMDVSGQPTSVLLDVSETDSVALPIDFVSLIRVAICDSNGNLQALGMNNEICLPRATNDCGTPIQCEDTAISSFGVNFVGIDGYTGNYRNGECMGRMFGIGGGNNVYGSFRIDWERGTLNFGHLIRGASCVVLEYISDMSTVNGNYQVHPFIIESIKAWIRWKNIEWKGQNVSADMNAERKYYLAEKQAKRRFNQHSIQDWLQALRIGNKASPKF